MKADDLKKRTKQFALRVLKLVAALPNTVEGRAIGNQLVRAGTAVAANYRAACRGRSKAEFIAKLGIVEEEADESAFWMELIIEAGLLKVQKVEALLMEAIELRKIMARSRISASRALKQIKSTPRDSKVISNRQSAIGNRQ
ncbi:MAG: four helix bundle protein [Blastocatellia bacterium]|nr:four helix bundle protein [Blastocatellia bacterium]